MNGFTLRDDDYASLAVLFLEQQNLENVTPEDLADLFVEVVKRMKNRKSKQTSLEQWFK